MRADDPVGPFTEIANLHPSFRSFTLYNLPLGGRSFFELHAIYPIGAVKSAPFMIATEANNNLIVNGTFEEDDDSHWDKWFSGDIPWSNMTGSSTAPHAGSRSMEIRLQNHGNSSSITQFSHYALPEDYLAVTPGVLYSYGGWMRSSGFTQNTEHWFEWDSSRTGENTNARPTLPWPLYFTPSIRAGAAATPWTYLNRVFEMPSGFPNVELRHRVRTDAPASGSVFLDDVFFRPLPPQTEGYWTQWISFGSAWRYLTTTPPADWYNLGFNDSGWPLGTAKFGQGGGPLNIVTVLPKNQLAYYFRREFYAPPGAQELILAATCTDDYGGKTYPMRVWINGVEIPGPVEAVSGEGNVIKYFDLAPFITLINPGLNVIAIMLNNTWQTTWDNVAFDVSLRAIPVAISSDPLGAIENIWRDVLGRVHLAVSANSASQWSIEAADALDNAWSPLTVITFSAPGVLNVLDPAAVRPYRFYRVTNQ
jgi:hypothetical protein